MNVLTSRILVLTGVSGLLFLTVACGLGATASQTNGPARVDASPKQSDTNSKRPDSKSKRSDGRSKRSDSSSKMSASSSKRGESSPSQTNYDSFKVIADHNIFSANRSGRSSGESKPVKVEFFALAGTLSYEKGTFAFFDGSGAEYRKVLESQGTIAGFKITEIAPSAAKLEASEQTVELRVGGMQLRREDEGEWKLSARTEVPSSPDSRSSSDRSSSSSRFGGDRGSSSSRFGGDRGSNGSRFGDDRGRGGGPPGNNGSSSRFSGGGGPGGGSSGDRGSSSRFSDNRGSSSSGSSNQGSSGVSREEALRRLMEQRARQ